MKARIKKTGEIVDVTRNKLDFGNEENEHWREVRERAAIAAMQGLLANPSRTGCFRDCAETAIEYADALIERLKKELPK